MVASENHNCVFCLSRLIQRLEQPAELAIDRANVRVVSLMKFLDCSLVPYRTSIREAGLYILAATPRACEQNRPHLPPGHHPLENAEGATNNHHPGLVMLLMDDVHCLVRHQSV